MSLICKAAILGIFIGTFVFVPFELSCTQIPLGGITRSFSGLTCGSTVPTTVDVGANSAFAKAVSPATTNQLLTIGTAGNAYIVIVEGQTASSLTVSDTCGASTNYDTFTSVVSNHADGQTGVWSAWIAYNIKACNSGGSGVTFTGSDGASGNVYVFGTQFTNIALSAAFDKGPASASGLTSGSVTTSCAHEMLIGWVAGGNGGTTPTAGSGWTLISATNTGSLNPGWEYKVVAATGSNSATFATGTGTVQTSILTFVTK